MVPPFLLPSSSSARWCRPSSCCISEHKALGRRAGGRHLPLCFVVIHPSPPPLPSYCSAEHKALEQQLEESQRAAAAQREAAAGKEAEEEAPQHLVHAAAALRDQLREVQAQASGLGGMCGLPALGEMRILHAVPSMHRRAHWPGRSSALLPLPPGRARRCYSSHPCIARYSALRLGRLAWGRQIFHPAPRLFADPTVIALLANHTYRHSGRQPPCAADQRAAPALHFCLLQLERRAEQLAAAAAERKRLEAEVAELKAAQQAQQAQQGGDEEDEEDAAAAAEVIGVLKQQLQAAQQAAAKVGGGIVVSEEGRAAAASDSRIRAWNLHCKDRSLCIRDSVCCAVLLCAAHHNNSACLTCALQASDDAEKMRAGNARLLKSARGKIEALNK